MKDFEQKAYDLFGEVVINKNLINSAGFSARAIPTYVGEWILYNFLEDGVLTEESRDKVSEFVNKYLPQKGFKEDIKNQLLNMETVRLLDDYSVAVNLKNGTRTLKIPYLDMNDAGISQEIVDSNKLLLTSGVWGVADLMYSPPEDKGEKGKVWMRSFRPFQVGDVDLEYYKNCRTEFSTEE